jgi:hypothetical protein
MVHLLDRVCSAWRQSCLSYLLVELVVAGFEGVSIGALWAKLARTGSAVPASGSRRQLRGE